MSKTKQKLDQNTIHRVLKLIRPYTCLLYTSEIWGILQDKLRKPWYNKLIVFIFTYEVVFNAQTDALHQGL